MYAVVSTVDIDPDRLDEATKLLPTDVIPSIQATTGFLRATFLRNVLEPRGMSIVLYDTEKNAKAAAAQAGGPADAAVTFTSTLVYEVVADTA
jgi:hypothetical protein